MDRFYRLLRLRVYFANDPDPDDVEDTPSEESPVAPLINPFKHKSKWNPPPSRVPALEAFISAVKEEVTAHLNHTQTTKDNLSPLERQALKSLKNNSDIVIKPADKGCEVVIMNRDDYIQEANRQLSNETFYRKVDSDLTHVHAQQIINTINRILEKGDIDNDTAKFLRPENPQAGKFYLLPKIHKPGNPGRPIINSINHPTENISKFVDLHLRPFLEHLPSFLKDTTDYLNKTPAKNLPEGTLLVTMDVVSLFTNIPHDDGIAACREAWERRSTKHPSTDSLVDLLRLVLTLNNFTFNEG
ncbi:uncharacterized protein LOC110455809 [Mizuhopecten yessoensis]|uniref:uncharacterized protein LOC110455809 n=1 Tax=Mizuhopecten yessoensis TaxID=6573 RepID=UPI000B45ABBE|nr:uncharacterized protein LOC110455809 [Mizuhopecten yessoensis]